MSDASSTDGMTLVQAWDRKRRDDIQLGLGYRKCLASTEFETLKRREGISRDIRMNRILT